VKPGGGAQRRGNVQVPFLAAPVTCLHIATHDDWSALPSVARADPPAPPTPIDPPSPLEPASLLGSDLPQPIASTVAAIATLTTPSWAMTCRHYHAKWGEMSRR